jgi:hypothetical protein
MDAFIATKRERQPTFADELVFTKRKQALQVLRRSNHLSLAYPGMQEMWATGLLQLSELIRSAGRLRLVDPVSSMAQQVAANRPTTLIEAMPMCRLPYQFTWLEWSPEERRADTALFIPNGLTMPKHEGMLLLAMEPTLRQFAAIPVWKHAGNDIPVMPSLIMRFDFRPEADPSDRDVEERVCAVLDHDYRTRGYSKVVQTDMDEAMALARLGKRCTVVRNPFLTEALALLERRDPLMLARLDGDAEVDMSGDGRFIVAALALLHARNATEREQARAGGGPRMRVGGPPLLPHHRVCLNLSRVAGNRVGGTTVAERRAHLVRGHFKVRKTSRTPEGVDLFWWNPHLRSG